MSWLLWTAVLVLLVVFVALQVRGVQALRDWGVVPSRVTLVLRVINTIAVLVLAVFAFLKWAN